MNPVIRSSIYVLGYTFVVGCTQESAPTVENVASLRAELSSVPEGLHCFALSSTGAGTVRTLFPIAPGAQRVQFDVRLPVGPQTITGEAFEASCSLVGADPSQLATWDSDPVFARLAAGAVRFVELVMHPRSNTTVTVNFPSQGHVGTIAAGNSHTCAILDDGTVSCWGGNFDGQAGQGLLPNAAILHPACVAGLPTTARAIAAGSAHTCALLDDESVWCWGLNGGGEVGNPADVDFGSVPVPVLDLPRSQAIGLGQAHSCAVVSDGSLRCWGGNSYGQLGDGTTHNQMTAVQVVGISGAVAVVGGLGHTCSLHSDGTVACWGWNASGQLGDGTTTTRGSAALVSGVANAEAIAAGSNHTCALLGDGTAVCWGGNALGQLGDGTTMSRTTPVLVQGLGSSRVLSLSSFSESTCAVLEGGAARCWGRNDFGQLGDGSTINRVLPVTVGGIDPSVRIAPALGHTCAISQGAVATCWGENNWGQLGTGNQTNSLVPLAVQF